MISITNMAQSKSFQRNDTFLSKNHVALNYLEKNNGENVVVFLHGFSLNLFSWENFHKEIIDNTRFYFIDLKGFGFSDKPKNSDYSITEQSNLIIEFLDTKNIKKFSLVGHSYGGLVSLAISNEIIRNRIDDLEIQKLILLDVPAYKEINPQFLKVLKNKFLSFFALDVLPTCFITNHTLKRTFYNYKQAKKNHFERYNYFFKIQGIDYSMRELANQIIPVNIDEIEKSLPLISCPTLIIWGENDELIPLEYGKKLNKKINNSILKIIKECGHVPHEEQMLLVKELLINFLKYDI